MYPYKFLHVYNPHPGGFSLQSPSAVGDFLKTLAGKIATAALSLAVVGAALAWYETDPATKHMILSDTGRLLGWLFLVLIVPAAGFALIGWVAKFNTNAAGASLVLLFTVAEAVTLAWLFGWSIHSATQWVLFIAAVLFAGVYNLFMCDWIAERLEP
jgi:hypothetical protein